MPGVASLEAQRYYAHPRNAFWPIMAGLLGFDVELPYPERLAALRAGGVALWDVLARCVRAGSLDSDIEPGSIEVHDFAGFLRRHAGVRAVLCNGGAAFQLFRRHALPTLTAFAGELSVDKLPSTSPANAAMRYERKAELWSQALRPWLR